jgi:pyruvate kinase
MLAKICVEAEKMTDYKRIYNEFRLFTPTPLVPAEAMSSAACATVLDLNIDLIIVITDTGKIARYVAKYRPPVPILACSS